MKGNEARMKLSAYQVDSKGRLIWPSTSSNIWEVLGLNIQAGKVHFTIRKLSTK